MGILVKYYCLLTKKHRKSEGYGNIERWKNGNIGLRAKRANSGSEFDLCHLLMLPTTMPTAAWRNAQLTQKRAVCLHFDFSSSSTSGCILENSRGGIRRYAYPFGHFLKTKTSIWSTKAGFSACKSGTFALQYAAFHDLKPCILPTKTMGFARQNFCFSIVVFSIL